MATIAARYQRMIETRLQPVGVFEDDALLLSLASRLLDSYDFALDATRLAESEAWEL